MAKSLNVIEQSIQSLADNTRNLKAQIAELSVDCLDHLHELVWLEAGQMFEF